MRRPQPNTAGFRFRVNGRLLSIATRELLEAEWLARQEASRMTVVEILDGTTGSVVKRFPEHPQRVRRRTN